MMFEDGGGEGVVCGETLLIRVDVDVYVRGIGEKGGAYVIGDRGRIGEEPEAR